MQAKLVRKGEEMAQKCHEEEINKQDLENQEITVTVLKI